jgi:hypothetical protein
MCNIPANGGGWWVNWKDSVFFAIAPDYAPQAPNALASLFTLLGELVFNPLGLPTLFEAPAKPVACGSPGSCLVVNPPSSTTGRKLVVLVAGRPLTGQQRSTSANRQNIANYLENSNASNFGGPTPPTFTVLPKSATFNDFLLYE